MSDLVPDPIYLTRAIANMGERCSVVANQAIFNGRGVKIIEKGAAVNASLYERLVAHQLSTPLEQAVTSAKTVSGATLREHAEQAMTDVPFFRRMGEDAHTRSLLLDAFEKQALPGPIAFLLSLAKEVYPELFRHLIHTALLAAWLTLDTPVSRFDLGIAAAGGLLHNIGMLHLDPVLLNRQSDLESGQRRHLYIHPLVSAMLIERHHEYPSELLRAVREHHEFLDGSGYPQHLRGQAISPLGRILSLGEMVVSMLTIGGGMSEMRLWIKLRMNAHRYDATLMARVVHHLQPHSDSRDDMPALMPDPMKRLMDVSAVVSDWPKDIQHDTGLSKKRQQGMNAVAKQANQLQRILAAAGVTPEQLAHLGSETMDDMLQLELTLLAQEAMWQLRSLARQTRLRWYQGSAPNYPDALQVWLDRADALVSD